MKSDKIKVIDSSFISTLRVDVSEEISSKYLIKFIRTNIENSDLTIDDNSYFYFTFIDSALCYEILVFTIPKNENFILEPFSLINYYKEDKDVTSVDLFITNNYFTIFKNKEFILLKKISNINPQDVQIYLEQSYKIKIDQTIILPNNFTSIQNNLQTTLKYKFFRYKEDNSFRYFLLFSLLCSTLFSYILFDKISNPQQITPVTKQQVLLDTKYDKLTKIYIKHNNKIITNTIDLFNYLKLNKITITTFKYANNKLNIDIVNKEKNKLFDFTTMYNGKIDIQSLNYLPDNQIFKMGLTIEY